MMRTVLYGALFIAGVWAATPSHAAATAGYASTVSRSGNVYTIASVPSNAANAATLSVSGSAVAVTQAVVIPFTQSASLNLATVAMIAGSAITGPWGAALGILGTAAMMGIPAYQKLYGDAGIKMNPDGTLVQKDPSVCTVGPCYKFARPGAFGAITDRYSTLTAAAASTVGMVPNGGYSAVQGVGSCNGANNPGYANCDLMFVNGSNQQYYNNYYFYTLQADPSTGPVTYIAITNADAAALVGKQPVTPDQVLALSKLGFAPLPGQVTVNGPSFLQLGSTTSISPDGAKSVATKSIAIAYAPSTATVTESTTTTVDKPAVTTTGVTTNADGSKSTTTTTSPAVSTTSTTTGETPPDPVASDSLLPEQPVLYVRKYPDGLVGVWNTKIGEIKATPLFSLGSQLMPNFGSSGSCPSWQLPMNLAGWANYGSLDVAPPCFVWDFGRVVIIVSSLLLARRLVFGG